MPGLRQTFVQLAFPIANQFSCPGTVQIITRWREYDAKTATTGRVLMQSEPREYPISNFNIAPEPSDVKTEDLGSGNIRVTINGSFDNSSRITIGGTMLDSSAFELTDHYLKFTASAQLLATNKAFLVGEDGSGQEILELGADSRFLGVPPCVLQPLVAPAPSPIETTGPTDGFLLASEPIGAHVVIDGDTSLSCSATPCRIKLKDGMHTVVADKDGISSPALPFKTPADGADQSLIIPVDQQQIRIKSAAILPFSEKASEVRVTLDRVPQELRDNKDLKADRRFVNTRNPLLVTVGSQTFGLRDQPIEISRVVVPGKSGDRGQLGRSSDRANRLAGAGASDHGTAPVLWTVLQRLN